MDKWVKPFVDISKWEFYDLSCQDGSQSFSKRVKIDTLDLDLITFI